MLDGLLLTLAGLWARRPGLMVWGAIFLVAAAGVGLYWRAHKRQLKQLREALEVEAMQLDRLRADLDKTSDS